MIGMPLIFDIGLHHGLDSRFYLDKGFRVLGVEANPRMIEMARDLLADAVADGRMCIEERAIASEEGGQLTFYCNAMKDDWSSVHEASAARDGSEVQPIVVTTTTLKTLLDRHGTPYYLKCDIEGSDHLVIDQLIADARRPEFVSFEIANLEFLAKLLFAGYDRFQLVNQTLHFSRQPPNPPREGRFAPATFTGHHSGLFGRELPREKWLSFQSCAEQYIDFLRLSRADPELAFGWLDIHATTARALM